MDATTIALASPISMAFGAIVKVLWDRWHAKQSLSVQAKQVEVDDESQLRKDLIAERGMLLNQLIEERKFYSLEMTGLRNQLSSLSREVAALQQEGKEKDRQILDQQGKIEEQTRLIHALRTELDDLKTNGPHNPA